MYSYAIAERAMAKVLGLDDAVREGALRAQLKYFSRSGIAPAGSGKGTRTIYERGHLETWLVALEFMELGIQPAHVHEFMEVCGKRLAGLVSLARRGPPGTASSRFASPSDLYVVLPTAFLSNRWNGRPNFDPRRIGSIWSTAMDGLLNYVKDRGRVHVFNLSARLRALDAALAAETAE